MSGLGEVRPTETDGWLPVGAPVGVRPRGLRFDEKPDRLYLAPWHRLRTDGGAASRLREVRNGHPLAHGLDLDPGRTAIRAPDARTVRRDLDRAAADLCQELRRRYPGPALRDTGELLARLEELETEVARLR